MFRSAAQQLSVLGEVIVAMALGGLIGFERETANRPAVLLAGACSLIVGLGGAMLSSFSRMQPELISADPFRLVGGVIAALGFIGAGTIFRRSADQVEGLTTAAAMLFSGCVGVSTALEQWWLAVGSSMLALAVLGGAWLLEQRALNRSREPSRT